MRSATCTGKLQSSKNIQVEIIPTVGHTGDVHRNRGISDIRRVNDRTNAGTATEGQVQRTVTH